LTRARLLVVVPVHDNATTLEPLAGRLRRQLGQVEVEGEVLFVDDGSTDRSWEQIEKLAAADPSVSGVRLRTAVGPAPAICYAASHRGGYDLLCTIDADLELRPEDLPVLLAAVAEGHDFVGGRRPARARAFWRRMASAVVRPAIRLASGLPIRDPGCGYTVMRPEVLRVVAEQTGGVPPQLWRPALWRAASAPTEVEVAWVRAHRGSGFAFRRLLRILSETLVPEVAPRSRWARSLAERRAATRPEPVAWAPAQKSV
jgi:glycosyltransferase involved in cell wall biosynthesis